MLNLFEKIYDRVRQVYGPKHFVALLALLLIISAAGLAVGVKYTKYIRKDPEYCNSCHLMRHYFADWGASDHKSVTCQQCHKLTVIEQDVLLVKFIIYGKKDLPQKHGKKLPWESCAGCHWEQKAQGKEMPEKSYGHYRHEFVQCFNCHPFAGHNFPYEEGACEKCHRDKHVHGAGMEGLACINCHIFSMREGTERNRIIPTRKRCMKCHEESIKTSFPPSAPMAGLECFDCHDPHGEIHSSDEKCRACHKGLTDRGHTLHKIACGKCHRPHVWKTPDPKATCSSCHPYRDPAAVFPAYKPPVPQPQQKP